MIKNVFFVILYSASTYLLQIINFIFNILLIKYLSSYNYGIYSYARILYQYFDYTHFGSRFTMDRLVPVSSIKKANSICSISLYLVLFNSFFLLVIFCVLGWVNNLIELLFCFSGVVFAIVNLYIVFRRDQGHFLFMIKYSFILVFLPVASSIFCILFYSNSLLSISIIYFLTHVLVLLFIVVIHRLYFFLKLPKLFFLKLRYILRIGFPLFLSSFVLILGMTGDKLLVKHYYGYTDLGIYSVILYVYAFLQIIPSTLGQVFAPSIVKAVVQGKKMIVYKSIIICLLIVIPTLLILSFILPYLIPLVFMKYSVYSNYMIFSAWSILPFSIAFPFMAALNALDKRKMILVASILSTFIYCILLYFCMFLNSLPIMLLIISKLFYGIVYVCILVCLFEINFRKSRSE